MFLAISLILIQGLHPVMASALVPGLGQMIQGDRARAQTFFIVEGAVWLSYFGFNYWGDRVDGSARVYAISHADANAARRDEEYFDDLETYFSSAEYNLMVERYASYFFPNDPTMQEDYIEANSYFGEDEWQWDELASRSRYWEQRRQAREHWRRASFMPGFAIINRVVSVVDVLLFSRQERFGFDTQGNRIGLYYRF